MCGVDVWRVAEVVGVPREVLGYLGGIVDPGSTPEADASPARGSDDLR